MITLQPGLKNWSCPHKQEARVKTIIEPYQKLFGNKLPSNKQYWTLCGEMAVNGTIVDGCELTQMITLGLIQPNQFHGIEGNPEIYSKNKAALKSPLNEANLYQGEFTEVLDNALRNNNFNPGIVYLDTIQEPKGASELLAVTLDVLNQTLGSVLLIWNFVKDHNYRNHHHSWESVYDTLVKNTLYRKASSTWNQFEKKAFQYNGTGRSSTIMGSVVFFRK